MAGGAGLTVKSCTALIQTVSAKQWPTYDQLWPPFDEGTRAERPPCTDRSTFAGALSAPKPAQPALTHALPKTSSRASPRIRTHLEPPAHAP